MFSYEYCKISKNSFLNRTPQWLLLDSNISNTNLNKKEQRNYFYILILAMQTKQILSKRYYFFSYIFNINKNLRNIDEKKFVLTACSRATYHLHVLFITCLNTCMCVGACECDRMPLLKEPDSAFMGSCLTVSHTFLALPTKWMSSCSRK